MSLGVDITKLTLHPLDFTQPDGFAFPVIDFTCDQGKTWNNPYDKETYQVPDQVAGIVSVPGGWENIITMVYETYSEVKREMSANAKVSFLKGMFSASSAYKRMNQAITNKTMVITDVYAFVSTSEGMFNPAVVLGLNNNAQKVLDMLPDSFNENPELYYFFITNFGTHYFAKAKFGGYLRDYYETNSNYYSKKTVTYLKAQAKASFLEKLSGKGKAGYIGTVSTVEEEFTKNTFSLFMNYGGATNSLEENGLAEWQLTVQSNPWLFGGSLMPIHDLINDTTKRDSMKQAVDAHMDKAFLGELQSLLKSFEHKLDLKTLEEKLDEQLQKVIPDHDAVTQLGNEIEDVLITPPSWWLKVKFCVGADYLWASGSQAGHKTLCSAIGGNTAWWYDNSHNGFKEMFRWKLTADTSEKWFEKVEVCFKYRPSPDADGAQCNNGMSLAEICAPVNSYTPHYYDATDKRPGGCLLSWQLRVPPGSPKWLLKTQLCFKWKECYGYKTGECGLGSNNTICAFANEWTDEYLDDTDNRSDHCYIQWGLTDSRLIAQEISKDPQHT